jgi:hypothetical protein
MGEAMLRTQHCGGAPSLQFYPPTLVLDPASFLMMNERERGGDPLAGCLRQLRGGRREYVRAWAVLVTKGPNSGSSAPVFIHRTVVLVLRWFHS